ncbi:MAG: 4Fe-4S binding protein, partial [Planctomycetaceae bacterium]
NRIVDLRIRESFDNDPYVGYVRTERSFWKHFKGQTLEELAQFDPAAAGVEGVSGATMTSLAIADTLVAAAKASLAQKKSAAVEHKGWARRFWAQGGWAQSVRWSANDWGSIAVLALALVSVRLRWFRRPLWRRTWLATAVVCIGLWTGNLVSMALIAGWSAEGIAWQLAPGLFAIAVTALVIPPLTKSNPYCSHLCPHGALQQLLKPASRSRRHLQLPAKWSRGLTWIPGLTLVAAYLTLILRPATELASWEPFHAYLFRIAGWASIALAVGSLAIAAWVPMAYCRLGCPTGRLLDHLRRSADSHRVTLPDYVAAGLLATAWALH